MKQLIGPLGYLVVEADEFRAEQPTLPQTKTSYGMETHFYDFSILNQISAD